MSMIEARFPARMEPSYASPEEAIAGARTTDRRSRFGEDVRPLLGGEVTAVAWNERELSLNLASGSDLSIRCGDGTLRWSVGPPDASEPMDDAASRLPVRVRLLGPNPHEFEWNREEIASQMRGTTLTRAFAGETILYLYFGRSLIVSFTILIDRDSDSEFLFWQQTE